MQSIWIEHRRSVPLWFSRVPAAVWIGLLWAVLLLPSLELRALHWEEGRNALLAQDMLANGRWLEPEMYGVRFVEKPALLPWLIAALAWLAGGISEWVVRLPTLVAVLLGGWLVQSFVRRYAGMPASLLAAACWFLNPAILTKARVGEPDVILAVISFAAFAVWWSGWEAGRVTWARWLVCGLLLVLVAAAKGPQPVAYFALGVLCFLAVKRSWRDLPGYVLCGALPALFTLLWAAAVYQSGDEEVWLSYMRLRQGGTTPIEYLSAHAQFAGTLVLHLLPGILLAVPLWAAALRGRLGGRNDAALALLLYAGVATLVLLFWPGAKTRYALPAFPAVAAAAGLMADLLWHRRAVLLRVTMGLLAGLMLYQLALVLVAMPLRPELFDENRQAGTILAAAIAADPAPVVVTAFEPHNVAYYVPVEMQQLSVADLASLSSGTWVIAAPSQAPEIRAALPAATIHAEPEVGSPALVLLRLP